MFISGTISQRIGLLGSVRSTGPHGGKLLSPPFTKAMNQCVPFPERNGRRAAACPVRPSGVPSHDLGYGLNAATSL